MASRTCEHGTDIVPPGGWTYENVTNKRMRRDVCGQPAVIQQDTLVGRWENVCAEHTSQFANTRPLRD